ncbi:uncharacterized protein LOC143029683 isoform X2 [Oratosquilla oratoria]
MWAPIHMRKIFVGGIDYSTTDESLKKHFSQWGEVVDAVVMKDPSSSRSRGFGFVTFLSPDHVDAAQRARPHKVDGRLVETKRAVPRNDATNPMPSLNQTDATHTRIFIGGLPQDVKEDDLETYFTHFGRVTCINIMYDKTSGRHRGFAFIDFNDYDPVDKVLLTRNHSIKGRPIDVKKAISKSDINKIKTIMSAAMPGQDGTMQTLPGGASSSSSTPSSTPLPGAVGSLPALPVGVLNGVGRGSSLRGITPTTSASVTVPGNAIIPSAVPGALGPPFFPRPPFPGLPGFSAHLSTGWQYSISNNAEVLRNTGVAASNLPSGAPSASGLSGTSNRVTLNAQSDGEEEEEEEEDEDDDQQMDMDGGIESWTQGGAEVVVPEEARILVIEPFFGGSHKQLIETISKDEDLWSSQDFAIFTLPSKKWHWRARTSALFFNQKIPTTHNFKTLFASSTLNLCELVALRPDLGQLRKIMYFHENQLVYPVRKNKERDFQYGYNQILSCLVADTVIFNSQYNMESFLRELPRHLKLQPDCRPKSESIVSQIREKSQVIYFPVNIVHKTRAPKDALEPLHIIWPHRWEHDKDPDTFFQVLYQLAESGCNFRLTVLGESYSDNPPIFTEARQKLNNFILHWGFAPNKEKYWELLHTGDVVVSTAHHEFFGVAMLEAVGAGCFPLCPNRLVYPEFFPQECVYNTTTQLQKSLTQWCHRPQLVRSKKVNLDLNAFSWNTLKKFYADILS